MLNDLFAKNNIPPIMMLIMKTRGTTKYITIADPDPRSSFLAQTQIIKIYTSMRLNIFLNVFTVNNSIRRANLFTANISLNKDSSYRYT